MEGNDKSFHWWDCTIVIESCNRKTDWISGSFVEEIWVPTFFYPQKELLEIRHLCSLSSAYYWKWPFSISCSCNVMKALIWKDNRIFKGTCYNSCIALFSWFPVTIFGCPSWQTVWNTVFPGAKSPVFRLNYGDPLVCFQVATTMVEDEDLVGGAACTWCSN